MPAPSAIPTFTAAPAAGAALRRLSWHALGTTCEIQYACPDARQSAGFEAAAVRWVETFEARYSRFRPDSLLNRINAAAGRDWVEIDDEMGRFLDFCAGVHLMTRGCLDVTAGPLMRLWNYHTSEPRLPAAGEIDAALRLVGWDKVQRSPGRVCLPEAGMSLDFGGWGKEYAVDAVARLAREHGLRAALVDFGHDISAVGSSPGKPAWHIGLEDPAKPGSACWGSVGVSDRAVASSGDYLRGFTIDGVRYGHIIDPRTGRPVSNGCRQVTVIAPSCIQAGILATTVFILGPEAGIQLVDQTMDAEAVILTDKTRFQTRGFYRYVVTA